MNATINAVCYKSKTLKNGEHPIMLRICKQGKMKYLSLGISLDPKYWDFKKNAPKFNCPNIDYIKKIILDKQMEYQKQMLELRAEDKEFTAFTLIESTKRIYKTKTVQDFFTELIEEFKSANRLGNAKVYKDTLATLNTFRNNNLDIPFSDIDASWLIQFEKWLLDRGYTETSASLRFRTLRSVFNKAIERKIIRKDIYPFDTFKISKFSTKTK